MNTLKDGLVVDLLGLRYQIIVSKDDGLMAHILHIDSSPRGERSYSRKLSDKVYPAIQETIANW